MLLCQCGFGAIWLFIYLIGIKYYTCLLYTSYQNVAEALADAGMHYVFTGHMHQNDIAKAVSDKDVYKRQGKRPLHGKRSGHRFHTASAAATCSM